MDLIETFGAKVGALSEAKPEKPASSWRRDFRPTD